MRIGVIGAGMYANLALFGYSQRADTQVTSICDVIPELAQGAAENFGVEHYCSDYRELLARDDVDLVHVIVPPPVHHRVTLDVIAAGKHVLTEKPLAMNEKEAAELLDAAERAGVVHAVGHEMRYDPIHRHLRDLVRSGFIGTPRLVSLSDISYYASDPRYPTYYATWSMQASQGGGVLLQHGAHLLDLVSYIFGAVEIAGGYAANQVPSRPVLSPEVHPAALFEMGASAPTTGEARVDGDDTAVMYGRFASAGLFVAAASWTVHHPSGVLWDIYGSEGTLRMLADGSLVGARSDEKELRSFSAPEEYALPGDEPWLSNTAVLTGELMNMFVLMAGDIAAAVDGRSTEHDFATFADGLVTQRAMDAISRFDEAGA